MGFRPTVHGSSHTYKLLMLDKISTQVSRIKIPYLDNYTNPIDKYIHKHKVYFSSATC